MSDLSPYRRVPQTRFVPADLDGVDKDAIGALSQSLLDRSVETADDFRRWLEDRSELASACSEAGADLYIQQSCHTDDPETGAAWLKYLQEVAPVLQRASFLQDRKQVALHDRFPMPPETFAVLERDTRATVALFREENIPLSTRDGELDQQYQSIVGAQTVEFDGAERPLSALDLYLESPDRAVRERAWRARADRRAQDIEGVDAIFDQMVANRDQMAKNAGCADYREYAFRSKMRFDYGPETCAEFHDACAEVVVPLLRALDTKRAGKLGLSPLRPWDLSVDPDQNPPLKPFADTDELVQKTGRIFREMDPELDAMYAVISAPGNLDLDSRKGKAPGGYHYNRSRSGRPFIFMNASGTQRNMTTMIHESGHAFHSLLNNRRPLIWNRGYPMEFAEVASMAMEQLTMPWWGAFYPDTAELNRAWRRQLEGHLVSLPLLAMADAFQHWIYLNPGHSAAERSAYWGELTGRFGYDVDWTGLETARDADWQRIPHLFGAPFYMIEYVIAGLGALQIWLRAREEGLDTALRGYKAALALGGSRPLPELFTAAGIRFDFGRETLLRLTDAVWQALEALDA